MSSVPPRNLEERFHLPAPLVITLSDSRVELRPITSRQVSNRAVKIQYRNAVVVAAEYAAREGVPRQRLPWVRPMRVSTEYAVAAHRSMRYL